MSAARNLPTVHRLKIWPPDLEQIVLGRKRSEVRRSDDRTFRVGDILELVAFDPVSGREVPEAGTLAVVVTHIERMAGPLVLQGEDASEEAATGGPRALVPVVVLSFEVRS